MSLELLVIHCTDTPEGRIITKDDILRWHTSPKSEGGKGWRVVGYSDMIYLDGSLINLTPFNQDNKVDPWEITNGARGFNGKSRHIVYAGGLRVHPDLIMEFDDDLDDINFNDKYVPADTRTLEQLDTMEVYVKYMIKRHPGIKVCGHNQISNKACPSFDTRKWLHKIGVEQKNILQ